jgi:spermidine synthase
MKKDSDRQERNIAILGCFFLSGAAGLIYQVAWTKSLGLIFGHTVYATAVVLAVFMAGLASGSVYLGRWAKGHTNPVTLYARIEFLIAATGALSLAGLAAVRSLYVIVYPVVSGSQIPLLALRLFGVTVVLFIPTLLMGATLPILVHSLVRSSSDLGAGVSQLYWVNTLGAVAGTLIAGFVLLPAWGLRVTICCAAAVNALAGMIALWASSENRTAPAVKVLPRKVIRDRSIPQQLSFRFLLFLFAVIGSTAFAYEIAWTRLLGITIGSSTYAFTLMLAAFLLGTVIGSAFFHHFFGGSRKISIATLSRTQIGIGMAALSSLVLFPWMAAMVPKLLRNADQAFGGLVLTQFVVSALAMLPTAMIFGFNFPMIVVLLDRSDAGQTGSSVTVGKAYAANTIGCIVGAVATGFWLVPWLGSFQVIGLAAAINLLLALVLDSRAPQRRVLHLAIDIGCFILAVVVGFSSLFYNQPLLMLSAVLYGNSHQRRLTFGEVVATTDLVFAEEGVNDSIAVVRTDANVSLRVNGKVDASTGDARTQLLLGHLGAALHPMPRRVLIIGFGSGMTASAVARYPDVEEIDCVEIEPAVIHAAPYLGSLNRGVLSDARVHVIFDDARNFLLTSRQKYDLIISEPSNPWIAGVATLFTDEFYAAARQRLAPGGMFVQWVQSYSLDPGDLRMIMATFAPHFAEVTLWRGEETDLLLLGRTDTAPLQFNHLRALWQNQALRADLEAIDVREPEGIVAYFLLDDAAVRKLGEGHPLNTDDHTLLEYHAPETMLMRGLSDANEEFITQFQTGPLPANLELAEVQRAVDAGAETALDLNDVRHAKSLVGILESQPASAQGYVAQGRFALLQSNLPDAKSFLTKALAIDSGSVKAMHWLAIAEHRSGDDASAQLHVSQILQRHPTFLPALEDEMLFAADRRDFQAALRAQLQRMALMSDPPASEYCRLGAIWLKMSNPTAAEPVLLKGTLKDPYSYACHLELGELYRETGRFPLARQHFEWVLRFFPDADATIFRSLAGVYVVLGDMKSARLTLRKGRRIFPDDVELQNAETHFDSDGRP